MPEAEPVVVPSGGLLRRNPDFAKLYVSAVVSYAGDWFAQVALLGLVLETTGKPALAGLMLASSTLPYAIASPFGGVIADRVDRKMLMITADIVRAFVALGFLAARSEETVWIAFVCSGLLSATSPLFEPASSAAMPNLVRKEDLASANVLMGSAWGTMLAVGAAIGGLVATTLGRDAAFVINSASFLVSAALISAIRGPFRDAPREVEHHVSIVSDVRAAVRFAREEPRVLSILVLAVAFGLAGGCIALLPVFGREVFGKGDAGIGLLMGSRGLGALVGPFVFRKVVMRGRDERLLTSISASFTLYCVSYALFARAPTIWLAAVTVCLAHIGGGANWTMSAYGLQRFTPDYVRGRVFSFQYAMIGLAMSVSFSLAGFAAGRVGPRTVALGIAGVSTIWVAAWTVWRRRLMRRLPVLEPSRP